METSLRVSNPWEGSPVFVRERVSSTMDEARALAREGCAPGTVVVAGFQEKGRGRAPGRSWYSAPWESLLATLVLDSRVLPFPLVQLPLRSALAACRAVEEAAGVSLQIKWPNDLLHEGRKLAGILCETCGSAVLVGFGVNCTQSAFPEELSGRVCSILQASGREIVPLVLLPAVLAGMKAVIQSASWRDDVRSRLASRGLKVRVSRFQDEAVVEGTVRDVDDEGRLILEDEHGSLLAVLQGEVTRS
ncbi:MAG TPA: biotin--[acetyl-CoA-carboxylase] ligase [Spirochaetia bacterium]|nr:biotin--[acetyl-CoA-carboxylase] ligase [Spirochaetia bacterium]